ncbi:MAG: type VII toxin-antitoxin system MntA family adenylyltransferase antitoxin [Tepidiformaceae bacterium]
MTSQSEYTIAAAAAYFAAQDDVLLAYLFGSRAAERAHTGSDWDFAVYGAAPLPYERQFEMQAELATLAGPGASIDLVCLRRAPIELQYNVVMARGRLFERSVYHRVEYEATVYSLYFDELPRLRRQRADLIAGGNFERGVQRHRESLEATRRKLAEARGAARGEPPGVSGGL